MTLKAHQAEDEFFLRKAHGFAEWCLRQEAQDLSNPAGVSFYEHLMEDPALWERIVPWLSPAVVRDLRNTWECWLLPEAQMRELG